MSITAFLLMGREDLSWENIRIMPFIWICAIFLSGFFSRIEWFSPDLFLLACGFITLKTKHLNCAFVYIFFGLTQDSFSSGLFGTQALSFFLTSFPALYMAKGVDQSNPFHLFVYGIVLGFCQEIFHLLLIWFFEGMTFWGRFFGHVLISGILPQGLLSSLGAVYFKKVLKLP